MARTQMQAIDRADVKALLKPVADQLPATVRQIEVLAPQRPPKTVEEFYEALSAEIATAKKHFMRIGALLDAADRILTHDERAAVVRRLGAEHDVKAPALSQMMTAYRAIVCGRIPAALEAAGYTTVYLLADLTEDERSLAEAEGLMAPGVRQAAVKEFRQRVRHAGKPMTEIERLDAEIARLEAKLAAARAKRGSLV